MDHEGLGAAMSILNPMVRSGVPSGMEMLTPGTSAQSVYVDTTFELIDVQRGLWSGQIDGQTVHGTFAGPFLQASQQGIPRHVRGWVQRIAPSGNMPAGYSGNVVVTIGQKTNVNEWLIAYVQSPYASAYASQSLSAQQALHATQMATAANASQAGRRLPDTSIRYQWGGLRGLGGDMELSEMQLAAGLGSLWAGLGIPGPYGANPSSKIDAGTYEISGTQVALRSSPGGAYVNGDASNSSFNNAYGANGNLVVPPPDQVDFDGQTGTAQGLTWAHVTVKSGALAGKTGYVAIEFMAPVGWTASHNGTGPAQGGGGGITPASNQSSSTTETDYTPYILGGAAILGLGIIGWAVLAKPKHGAGRRRRRHA